MLAKKAVSKIARITMTGAVLFALLAFGSRSFADEPAKQDPSVVFARTADPVEVLNFIRYAADPTTPKRDAHEGPAALNPTTVLMNVAMNPALTGDLVQPFFDAGESLARTRYPNDIARLRSYTRIAYLWEMSFNKQSRNGHEILLSMSQAVLRKFDKNFARWKTLSAEERISSSMLLGLSLYKFNDENRKRMAEFYKVATTREVVEFVTHLTTASFGAQINGYHLSFAQAFFRTSKEMSALYRVVLANAELGRPLPPRLFAEELRKVISNVNVILDSGSKAYVTELLETLEGFSVKALSDQRFQQNLHELFLNPEFVMRLRAAKERFPSLSERVDALRSLSDQMDQREMLKPSERLSSIVREHAAAAKPLRSLMCKRVFESR